MVVVVVMFTVRNASEKKKKMDKNMCPCKDVHECKRAKWTNANFKYLIIHGNGIKLHTHNTSKQYIITYYKSVCILSLTPKVFVYT